MDVNNFYKEVFEDNLRLDVLGLENRYPELIKFIERKTITAFSLYIPCYYILRLNLMDDDALIRQYLQHRGREYYLKDEALDKFNLPILGIETIKYASIAGVDAYDPGAAEQYNMVAMAAQNLTLENVLMGSEYTYSQTLINSAIPYRRHHELRGSRVLYLEDYMYSGPVDIYIKTKYPNIVSIPEEFREVLINLALLDVKIYLWGELKFLEDVVTPSGNLNLKVSDWEGAASARDDFIKDLRQRSFPDRVYTRYFNII